MTRPAHLPRKKSAENTVTCERCKSTSTVRKSYRLNRNLQPEYARLCVHHQKALGYVPVDHNRAYADMKFQAIL